MLYLESATQNYSLKLFDSFSNKIIDDQCNSIILFFIFNFGPIP